MPSLLTIPLFFLLPFLQPAASQSSYPPCPAHSSALSFSLSSYTNTTTTTNLTQISFTLISNTGSPQTLCSGTFSPNNTSAWLPCSSPTPEYNTTFSLQTSFFGPYLYLQHTFSCSQPTTYKPVVHGTADITLSAAELTTATKDNETYAFSPTEIHVPLSPPRLSCAEILSHPTVWLLRGLSYTVTHTTMQSPWFGQIPTIVADIAFDVFNTGNEFVVRCEAVTINGYKGDEDDIMDPGLERRCPFNGDNGGDNYPETRFWFGRTGRWLDLVQGWKCQDGEVGRWRTFEGRFNLTLTEACLTSGGKECDGEIKVVPDVVETTAQRG